MNLSLSLADQDYERASYIHEAISKIKCDIFIIQSFADPIFIDKHTILSKINVIKKRQDNLIATGKSEIYKEFLELHDAEIEQLKERYTKLIHNPVQEIIPTDHFEDALNSVIYKDKTEFYLIPNFQSTFFIHFTMTRKGKIKITFPGKRRKWIEYPNTVKYFFKQNGFNRNKHKNEYTLKIHMSNHETILNVKRMISIFIFDYHCIRNLKCDGCLILN